MCISLVTIYCIQAWARYILLSYDSQAWSCAWRMSRVWRKSRFLKLSIGRRQHAGAWAPSLVSRLLPRHHCDGRIIWTEPVKYWRKACLLACLNHIVPLQIMAMSLALPSIIVLADDAREKKRPKANSTSNRMKSCHH